MTDSGQVAQHYAQDDLIGAIRAGIERLGKTTQTVTLDDLAPVDEFHIGGRVATRAFLDPLTIDATHRVLDVGCGIGGASRFAAQTYGCRVTGIDLTANYVDTGNTLNAWLGFDERVTLSQGDVLRLSLPDGAFDKAFMLHVGMNIPDKNALALEIARVLKPGGTFGVYDIMLTGADTLAYPVPWATVAGTSALATAETYKQALMTAGFEIVGERNRREFALDFFQRLKAAAATAGGPPPLGLHLLMGGNAPQKVQNMIDNIVRGCVAPIELIARRR